MKTRKIVLLIIFIIGVISLWLMSSFTNKNACEYATSNIEYIKEQIEAAILANSFDKSKYFVYKALSSIEKTRSNFMECGCDGTIVSLEKTASDLKLATKAPTAEISKKSLHAALDNTLIGMKILQVFEQEYASIYGTDILVMNTKEALQHTNDLPLPQQGNLRKKVHNCLLGFESSLEKVVTDVECNEAVEFITKIHDEASVTLLDTNLSEAKKQYHQRVRTIAKDALSDLGDCNSESK
ncbi:hypothetical protein GTQ34_00245 [Muricauda sp. JGD-17]|uniref:Uncharacterized protein n=1 Tax=Flagellimonas ochracea TaxID=2696472 RepID=A0A964T8U0_9FLAO|nr:hypothetical protein [Allomuricauda ochracea]NAY90334.1 hypothetical protein [Allomuricauda ochracea]